MLNRDWKVKGEQELIFFQDINMSVQRNKTICFKWLSPSCTPNCHGPHSTLPSPFWRVYWFYDLQYMLSYVWGLFSGSVILILLISFPTNCYEWVFSMLGHWSSQPPGWPGRPGTTEIPVQNTLAGSNQIYLAQRESNVIFLCVLWSEKAAKSWKNTDGRILSV